MLVGVGQLRIRLGDGDVFLDAAQLSELSLDNQSLCVGCFHDALGDGDVFLEGLAGCVDHDGAVEAGVDAVHAGRLVTVVQVDGEDGLWEDLVCGADDALEHQLVGVAAGALGDLDDERSLAGDIAAEEAHALFQVVDVVGADGVLAVGVLEEFLRGDNHRFGIPMCLLFWPCGRSGKLAYYKTLPSHCRETPDRNAKVPLSISG